MAPGKESYFWHKLHSLTGIIPIGFYMLQHLTLNSFSLAGPEKFNGVIGFFAAIPKHLLLALEIGILGLPILFHSIYGLFITSRAELNYGKKLAYRENLMFVLQRYTGVALFLLLIAHVATTTVNAKINGEQAIQFAAWHEKLTSLFYIPLVLYMFGVAAAAYHLSYGLWNFCIRWGITVSTKSQKGMEKVSAVGFVLITLLGWGALVGFLRSPEPTATSVQVSQPQMFQQATWNR